MGILRQCTSGMRVTLMAVCTAFQLHVSLLEREHIHWLGHKQSTREVPGVGLHVCARAQGKPVHPEQAALQLQ